jgi:hypothetical protein
MRFEFIRSSEPHILDLGCVRQAFFFRAILQEPRVLPQQLVLHVPA